MQEVEEIFQTSGLPTGPVLINGKWQRFKVGSHDSGKSGFYVVHQFTTSQGQIAFLGLLGDWHSRQNDLTFNTIRAYTKEDRIAADKILKKIEKQSRDAQSEIQEETAIATAAHWKLLSDPESANHPYLLRKNITEVYGCKMQLGAHGRELLVPVRDVREKFWGYQRIQEDGQKFFFSGTKKLGNFHLIGEWGPRILVCEGFATGASLHLASGLPTVIAFDTSNLGEVSRQVREYHKEAAIFICGDDDVFTEGNPGRLKAKEAAAGCMGIAIFPKFKNLDSKPTDFNDLHCLEGIASVRSQIVKEEGFRPVLNALGYDKDGNYFYTTSKNKAITILKTHTKSDLFRLFPFEYWEALYKPEGKGAIQWDRASATLMDMCHERGIYNPKFQRGYGIWNDAGRVVIHLGDRLYVDGSEVELHDFKSKFIYELSARLESLDQRPLTVEEIDPFLKRVQQISFKNYQSYVYFLGWIATSLVAGAIPWRTHIWIKGDRGSGKSSIFEYLNYILSSAYQCIYRTQKTTEAHLRGVSGSSVIPILIDEFEGHKDQRESTRVNNILDLFRQASSDSEAPVGKSSASHKSFSFNVKFSGAVGSITHELEDPADKSRFVMVDFDSPKHSAEEWVKLKSELYSFSPEFCRRLFARLVQKLPVILANHQKLKGAIQKHYIPDPRTGDQFGTLLAGYAIFHSDGILSDQEAKDMAGLIEWNVHELPHDAEDRLKWLMGVKLYNDGVHASVESLYLEACNNPNSLTGAARWLQLHGMKVTPDKGLFISTDPHGELDKLLGQSPWKKGFSQGLIKLPGMLKNQRARLAGETRKRGYTIPAHYFADDLAQGPQVGQLVRPT